MPPRATPPHGGAPERQVRLARGRRWLRLTAMPTLQVGWYRGSTSRPYAFVSPGIVPEGQARGGAFLCL
jgi:hypothetical protein